MSKKKNKKLVKKKVLKNTKKQSKGEKRITVAKMGQVISFPLKVLQPLINYLKTEEKKLKKRRAVLKKEDPFADKSRVDDNAVDTDVAEQVDHERVSAMQQQVNRSLAAIRKTMTRVKLGRYGICEECGRMIDTDRLAIKPTAEYCVKCEQKLESGKGGK